MRRWIGGLAIFLFAIGVAAAQEWKVPDKARAMKNPVAKTAGIADAKAAYEKNCMLCHGVTGKGDGPAAAAINPKPKNFGDKTVLSQSDGEFFWKITEGRGLMPGWKTLPEQVRWGLVNYVRSLGGQK